MAVTCVTFGLAFFCRFGVLYQQMKHEILDASTMSTYGLVPNSPNFVIPNLFGSTFYYVCCGHLNVSVGYSILENSLLQCANEPLKVLPLYNGIKVNGQRYNPNIPYENIF